jgi:type IV secretion system protein TrbG
MKTSIPILVAFVCTTMPAAAETLQKPSPVRAVATANRLATVEPTPGMFVNARQLYVWSEGSVYHAYTAPGMVTDIALQPGEGLIAVAAGDTARWVIGDTTSGSTETKQTHILVKPFAAGLSTNLVIATDRRTYHLRLTSSAGPAMAALSWTYPQDALVALKRQTEIAENAKPVASGLAVEYLHFDYGISGDRPHWRPIRAFDDGRQTFIEFPPSIANGEAPPLFLIGAEGKAELVNYRMQGRYYVVDRIFDVAELRLGTRKQQVVRITRGAGKRSRS